MGLGCPGADVGKECAQFDQPGICSPRHFFASSRAALDRPGASNSVRNIVTDMAGENNGTVLYIGMLFCHVVPEVCKCDRFMPQRPVNSADAGFVGLQMERTTT